MVPAADQTCRIKRASAELRCRAAFRCLLITSWLTMTNLPIASAWEGHGIVYLNERDATAYTESLPESTLRSLLRITVRKTLWLFPRFVLGRGFDRQFRRAYRGRDQSTVRWRASIPLESSRQFHVSPTPSNYLLGLRYRSSA